MLDTIEMDDIDFGLDDRPDLHELFDSLRTKGPYALVRHRGRPALMVVGHALLAAAFKDEAGLPAHSFYEPRTRPVHGRTIQCMTGDEHRINRALVSPAFRHALMESYRTELIEPLVHELIDEFVATGSADLVSQFTSQLPFRVITRLLGIPQESDPQLRQWAYDLFNYPHDPRAAVAASESFTRVLRPLVARKRSEPADDLLSTLAAAEVEGRRLTDDAIYTFARLLFPAGVDTTYLSLGNMLYALLSHRDQLQRVRREPKAIRWAVEEALRWEPPVSMLGRRALSDLEWHGIHIPADTEVVLAITAANRDPDVYADPHRFDIGRRKPAPLTFGSGPHACIGMLLARTQMAAALRVILDRLPGLRLADPGNTRISSRLGTALRGPATLAVEWGR